MTSAPVDFVLALHSHLPYVLHHGRWPHGSDWLCEAAVDTYLPLLEVMRQLQQEEIPAPVTIGFTPVLAAQLASPAFAEELAAFLSQRLAACVEATASLAAAGETALLPLVDFWRDRLRRLQRLFHEVDGDLIGAFRQLEASGRIEIMGGAATHGFLPLLARDESIRLQLGAGAAEHRRLFGRAPVGCWLPECAYRPRGPWEPWPTAPRAGVRRGIEEHLADAGFRYFFVDAHLAGAGHPLGLSGNPFSDPALESLAVAAAPGRARRSPYHAYRVAHAKGGRDVSALVRDPRTSMQVWSRFDGYPGDASYLEFHKMRWPGGLKLWRVSGPQVDLGAKRTYDPAEARKRAWEHGRHFAGLLAEIASGDARGRDAVIATPFDTELFGHWWFEGPEFLGAMYRELRQHAALVRPATGARHLAEHAPKLGIRLPSGSWGSGGDYRMWLGESTAWTWERLWPLEQAFWDTAPSALSSSAAQPVLEQAARELLLAQSSDWQFIISTGAAADYAERRFREHCAAAESLVGALNRDPNALTAAQRHAEELFRRDRLFPGILPAVAAALGGSRSLALD